MKKIINVTGIFLLIFLYGCQYEAYRSFEESQVAIDKSDVIFTAAGGTGTINISGSEQFTATVDQSWCNLSTSGNTITITVGPNLSNTTRSANVSIKTKDKMNFVPVSQYPVYIQLDSYETIVFLGKGGTISLPFECDAPLTATAQDPWLTASVQGKQLVLQATQNSDFLQPRTTSITLTAGADLYSIKLNILQGEAITSAEPDPDFDVIDAFLNLKNNNETTSRYRITLFSPALTTTYTNLKTAFPMIKELRIEAPRGANGLSFSFLNDDDGTIGYYYMNCTNGLVRINGSNFAGAFAHSGNSYSGFIPAYTSNANYTTILNFLIDGGGFTIFPDESGAFWFRNITNPNNYFKAEPASW